MYLKNALGRSCEDVHKIIVQKKKENIEKRKQSTHIYLKEAKIVWLNTFLFW